MRIGLVSGEFPPMEGGVGAFTQELARALSAQGHAVHVITGRDARPADAPRRLATVAEPIDLGFAQLHPRIGRWRWPSLATVVDIALRHELDAVDIQYQAAAYNMRSAAINLLPWRLKGIIRVAVTFHDLRVPYLFPKAGPLRRRAVTFMARQAQGVIATNAADYETLRPQLEKSLVHIPIGSNIEPYQPHQLEIAAVREELALDGDDILLGYFGFLNESKGADTLLEALQRLGPRYHLVFIGGQTGASDATNAGFLKHVQAEIAAKGLSERVHWTGFLSDARVSAHLHAADLMVMPYRDGASLRRGTLMAALAHGRPLVTTTPPAPTPELVHGENVWLVPAEDPAALTAAVETLAAAPALRAQLGGAAAATAEQFSWDKIAARTAEFLAALPAPQHPDVI